MQEIQDFLQDAAILAAGESSVILAAPPLLSL